jgi:hypothetical protein
LNEPFADCHQAVIRKFDNLAFELVRKNMGINTNVYIGDTFNATKWNDGFWTKPAHKGTFLDSHYYHGKVTSIMIFISIFYITFEDKLNNIVCFFVPFISSL